MNSSYLEEQPYYVFKLRSGETIFGELIEVTESAMIHIRKPLLVKSVSTDTMTESLVGSDWIPFVDYDIFKIPMDMIFFHGTLNKDYTRFYGSVLLKTELYELNNDAQERIERGESDYHVILDLANKLRDISDYMATKFDIDIPDIVHSTEEKLKTMKQNHLH